MPNNVFSRISGVRIIILFVACISLLPCLASASKLLHSEWHYSGESFVVGDEVIMLTHYDFYSTTVLLSVNERSYLMREGECKSSATREYCIADIYQEIDNATSKDPIKFINGKAYAGIKINITSKGPELKFSRTLSNTSILPGQDIVVSVTITNNASEGTESFIYEEEVPEGVSIISASSTAQFTPNKLTYSKNIQPYSQATFSYTLRLSEQKDFTSFATANYTYQSEKYGWKSQATKVVVKKPYELSVSLSPTKVQGYEQSILKLTLTNKVSEQLKINKLQVIIPENLSVLSASGLIKAEGYYYWTGSLSTGSSEEFVLNLKPLRSGKHKILLDLSLSSSTGWGFKDNSTAELVCEIKPLSVALNLSETIVSGGGSIDIFVSAENQNEKTSFRNIRAKVKSSFFEMNAESISLLLPKKAATMLFMKGISVPLANTTQKAEVEVQGSYESSTGETFNFSKKQAIQIIPLEKSLTITQKADKTNLSAGDEVIINVSLKNNINEDIKVEIADSLPEGALLVAGKTSETLLFNKAETKQAYSYKLRISDNYSHPELTITTNLKILGRNYSDSKTLILKVKPSEKPVPQEGVIGSEETGENEEGTEVTGSGQGTSTEKTSQTGTGKTSTSSTQTNQSSKQKTGLFQKIIASIRSFFAKFI